MRADRISNVGAGHCLVSILVRHELYLENGCIVRYLHKLLIP